MSKAREFRLLHSGGPVTLRADAIAYVMQTEAANCLVVCIGVTPAENNSVYLAEDYKTVRDWLIDCEKPAVQVAQNAGIAAQAPGYGGYGGHGPSAPYQGPDIPKRGR